MKRASYQFCRALVPAAAGWLVSLPVVGAEAEPAVRPGLGEPVGVSDYLQTLGGLLVVVMLIFAVAWFMRRMGGLQVGPGGALRVLSSMPVGQRERIVLVQVGAEQVLIGVAPGSVRLLHTLEQPVEAEVSQEAAGGFAERLARAMRRAP